MNIAGATAVCQRNSSRWLEDPAMNAVHSQTAVADSPSPNASAARFIAQRCSSQPSPNLRHHDLRGIEVPTSLEV